MIKAFKVRIYPNSTQKEQIDNTMGACRFLYNSMLYERKCIYDTLKDNKRELYEYKYKTEVDYKKEYLWMYQVDSKALQQTRIDLQNAYANFFKSLSGKRKGKMGFPKFKKKKHKNSYRTLQSVDIDFDNHKIKLPKLKWVNYRDKRGVLYGTIKSATVSKTPTGKYFVSILIDDGMDYTVSKMANISKDKVIGLDMSMDKFFVDNEGRSPAYERIFRGTQSKLKRYQRLLSKKKLYSSNWYKANYKVNLIHENIANKRKDFTHKLSTDIVNNNDVIVVENLNLKAMAQCLKLGKSISDLGYSEFLKQLEYKCLMNDKIFFKADRWFASSKICSACGYKYKELKLKDREWICPNCGIIHDRDMNAGKNLQHLGIELIGLEQPELKPLESMTSDELVTICESWDDELGSQ